MQTTAHKAKAANIFAGKPYAGSALNEESLLGILSLKEDIKAASA